MEHFFAGSPSAAHATIVKAILEAVREGRPFCQFERSNYFTHDDGGALVYVDTTHVCLFAWPAEPKHFQVCH